MPRYMNIDELIRKAETVPYGNEIGVERFKIFVNQNYCPANVKMEVEAGWINCTYTFKCSRCQHVSLSKTNYCAYCGAKMKGI